MADVENNDELFVDNAHTPKEGVEHHRKEEREGKVLGGYKQWIQGKAAKANNKNINYTYVK